MSKTKIPYIFKSVSRVLVIGDLHGDIHQLLNILIKDLQVFDTKLNWIAKPNDTIIVQMGDTLDYCRQDCDTQKPLDFSDDISLLKLMTYLHIKASSKGGMVLSLLGNHELMNVQGDFRYVSRNNDMVNVGVYNGVSGLKDKMISRRDAFKQGGVLSTFLANTRTSCIIIGDWIFVHGGVSRNSEDFEKINTTIYKWLINMSTDEDNLENILHDSQTSIFWNRTIGKLEENIKMDDDKCEILNDPSLRNYYKKKIVVGHTIQTEGITSTCGSNIFRVDTAISSGFNMKNKKRQVMEILNNKTVRYHDVSTL